MFLSKEGMLAFVQPTPPLKGVAVLRLEGVHEIAHHEWHLFDQMSDSGSLQIVLHLLEKQKEKLAYVNLTWGPTPHSPSQCDFYSIHITGQNYIQVKFF